MPLCGFRSTDCNHLTFGSPWYQNSRCPKMFEIQVAPLLLLLLLLKFKSKYVSEVSSYENTKHMKSILNFSNFPKLFKKKLEVPTTHPNPQMKISKFRKNLIFFRNFEIFICGFGCAVGVPSPFFENFWKVRNFQNTFHMFSVFIR